MADEATPVAEEPTEAPGTPQEAAEAKPTPDRLPDNHPAVKALEKANKEAERLRLKLEKQEAANQTEAEKALSAAKAEGYKDALASANARIVKAELRAAAAGVLQDLDDVVHIDPSQFEVDEDGNVDTQAIKAEVQRLATAKPHLAAGAKPTALPGGGATPSQGISMDDLIRGKARGH